MITITSKDIQLTRKRVLDHFLKHGIHDEDDLWWYIDEFLGFKIPRIPCCEGHTAPFDMVRDMFFEKLDSVIGFGSRGSGKTLSVAILNHLDSVMKKPCDITVAAAARDQTLKGYRYFVHTFADPLLKPLCPVPLQIRSEVFNPYRSGANSIVQVISGTMRGLNGPHPIKCRLDEVELLEFPLIQEALSMSISAPHTKAQDLMTSTRKSASGTFQRLLDEAPARGIKVLKWCVLDVLEQCKRQCKADPVYGDCPAYSFTTIQGREELLCGGKAHDSHGYMQIADFIRKVRQLDLETLKVQWFSDSPSEAQLVYGNYFRDESPMVIDPIEVPDEWTRIGGVDPQAAFSFCNLALDRESDIMYAVDEYVEPRDVVIREHVNRIRDLPGKSYRPGQRVFIDPSGKQQRIDLVGHGLSVRIVPVRDRNMGINAVKTRLAQGRLKIFRTCTKMRAAFRQFEYRSLPDGRPDMTAPSEAEPDIMAALRYGVHGWECERPTIATYRVYKSRL